ncbi:MAG TPA: ABC transporter substrate-binding protein [Anaerolineae bacterium]|nr:ABC transporter substrate-binding protein [Anaerolineae bacterium]
MKKFVLLFAVLATIGLVAACAPAVLPTAAPPTSAPAQPTSAPAQPTSAPAQPTSAPAQPTSAPSGEMTKVTVQLQWVPQTQFCGYYTALDKGYWKEQGLDVTIKPGAVEIVPQQVVASGGAEFAGGSWLPKVLASIDQGANLVNIAQYFQRSGTLEVSWKDSNITKPEDFKGKKVGSWLYGNEPELFAAMRKVGIDPNNKSDVTIVQQDFTMNQILNKQIDAAQAMTYNEYAQVLEAVNPATGQLYQPSDLNVINFNDVGTGMLQDGVWVRGDWISDPKNQDTAVKFLTGLFKGWIYCRDNFDDAVATVLKYGTTLGKGHMTWQLNEVNKLIWPSPNGIGIMDQKAFDQTAQIAQQFGIIKAPPKAGVFTTEYAQKALDALKASGADVTGANFKPQTVQITKGGE